MGIFHNQYTITIGQYEIMEITGDKSVLNRLPFPLPKRYIDKAYKSMMLDYNKGANQDKIDQLVKKDFSRIYVDNDIAFLYILERIISACATLNESKEVLNELYKYKYGKDPETKEDFERPFKERQILQEKAKQYFSNDDNEYEKLDIQKLIRNIEMILKNTITNQKLFKLAGYIEDSATLNKLKQ